MGILLMLVATVLPIHQKVTTDEHRIKHHQLIKLALHNELQAYILTDKTLDSYKSQVAKKDVQMSFTMEDEYVKGCATWENALKEKRNPVCTASVNNESGFTFATLLLTLVIILLMLPVFSLLLQIIRFDSNHSQVDAQQFFHYLNEEALIAETVEIDQSKNLLHFRV